MNSLLFAIALVMSIVIWFGGFAIWIMIVANGREVTQTND